jgi:TIR domain/WD domain, G-beta repeat
MKPIAPSGLDPGDGDPASGTFRPMKVFVSYSRSDVDFADQLILLLNDKGYNTILDRHDIDAAEKWKDRLAALIFSCDTVVFVLSDRSAASATCAWEVEEADRQKKRLIPVVPRQRQSAEAPELLKNLNYIHFYPDPAIPGSGMFDGALKLDRALKIDLDWLRRQTHYSEQANSWADSRSDDLLLRGAVLEAALSWRSGRPKSEVVSGDVAAFIDASSAAEEKRKAIATSQLAEREAALDTARAAIGRVRRATYIGAGATLIVGLVAILMTSLAARAIANSSKKNAALFARQAQDILLQTSAPDRAILMVLYGDPASLEGTWDPIIARLTGSSGYEPAFATLVAAVIDHNVQEVPVGDARPGMGEWMAERSDATPDQARGRGDVRVAAISRNQAYILTGHEDGTARLWFQSGGQTLAEFPGHGGGVASLALSNDGRQFLATSADGSTRRWIIPPIVLATPRQQIRMACEHLRGRKAPLSFKITDSELYSILDGEPPDRDNPGYFTSPCAPVFKNEPRDRD